jgi:hypothetical protein
VLLVFKTQKTFFLIGEMLWPLAIASKFVFLILSVYLPCSKFGKLLQQQQQQQQQQHPLK